MSAKRFQPDVLVRRITVDERLADDLIRLLVCPLAEGVEVFLDREEDWADEHEVLIHPETYAQELGIPSAQEPEEEDWPWEALKEGQVFLSGEFEIVGDPRTPKYFKVSPGQKQFVRVDNLEEFKEDVKRIYSDLLTRS